MSTNNKDHKIKRLIYRSKNRGCKENDLLLGNFAEAYLHELVEGEIELYQDFIEESDNDILSWLTGMLEPSVKYANLVKKIKSTIKYNDCKD
ncbi:MAG: succinate dehydrogenase assembly factor 2 [Rickettsiaceae bacterium]|jgi:succinate dehydrogenase flavin-adding protein (antitoxin of CptAB toxin-antitoxin module)|nr:succinate dehydrogenase assembly factor 2 [Rickettsiaceae bacterium]